MSALDAELTARWERARQFAKEAGQVTMQWFGNEQLKVDRKSDASPVTEADRQAERLLRERIAAHFPGDGILGEEFGETTSDSDFRWILDPIDGTKSFICGVPLFATMVAVEYQGRSRIGVLCFPGLDEIIFAAKGEGAWHAQGEQPPRAARVSKKSRLAEAVIVTSDSRSFAQRGAGAAWNELERQVCFTRTWGDAYGYMLVATGRADAMIDPILSIWDAAAVQPIIEEAGGRFSDWQGASRIDRGDACGSNGAIHDSILALLRSNDERIHRQGG